jgi:hypothetical protein
MKKSRFLLLAMIIAVAVCLRTLPYLLGVDARQFASFVWNFSPITALFLFTGALFPERRWAYGAPLTAMLMSDVAIGVLLGDMSLGLHAMIPAIYGSYALIIWSGALLRKLQRRLEEQTRATYSGTLIHRVVAELLFLLAVCGAGIAGECVFFVITNFANWAGQTGYYPHTLEGLMQCYVAGIPFFKNALASTPLYGLVLFGGSALAAAWFPALFQRPAAIENTEQALLA